MLKLKPLLDELSIKTTSTEIRPFDLSYIDPDPTIGDWGWAQRPFIQEIERQYNTGRPVRIIVLKARQLGISTATEAVLFLWATALHRGTNSLVISHEDGQAQELFAMTRLYWETWPHRSLYTLRYSTKRQLQWAETRSQVRVATAKNLQSGRGSTIHALHGSEVAFWQNPKSLWTGLDQTIPNRHGTIVVLESTANGVGNWFHDMWIRATEGDVSYVPMFFPWYRHPAYQFPTRKNTKLELNLEERALHRLMTAEHHDEDYIYSCISWRHWKILNSFNGDVESFMQEYPSTAEEAFLTAGRPIFSPFRLRDCFEELKGARGYLHKDPDGAVRFVQDPSGSLTLYKRPNQRDKRTDRYFVSGDPSESIAGDPACIQVLNRSTLEQVAVWHGRTSPVSFADEMILIGEYFNHSMICPEVEGGGQAAMGRILSVGYDNIWMHSTPDRLKTSFNVYGWSTNYQRKQWCIGFLQRLINDASLKLHDRVTYNQLRSYVQRDDGTWGNNDHATYDDAVMALAIGVTASDRIGPFTSDQARTGNIFVDIYNQETPDEFDIYNPA